MSKQILLGLLSLFVLSLSTTHARTIVVSTQDNLIIPGNTNQGWWSSGPGHSASNSNENHFTGIISGDNLRSFFSFFLGDLAPTETVLSATLRLQRFNQSTNVQLGFFDVTTDPSIVNNNTGFNSTVFNDLGSGVSYGTFDVAPGAHGDILEFSLNASALTDIKNAAGNYFTVGGSSLNGAEIFSGSSTSTQQLVLEVGEGDPVPEPQSLVLLSVLILGAYLKSRKDSMFSY